ncbi:MAG: toprim domain-containing protein [Actinomycetota bacterium]
MAVTIAPGRDFPEVAMAVDREEVLARTDLAALADELLGPHKGRGRSATWPCPERNHGPQTGRTPPVSVYESSGGTQRWHCHGCGAGGTAADLVMTVKGVGFAEALEDLARRGGVGDRGWEGRRQPPRPLGRDRRDRAHGAQPQPAVEAYVAAAEAHLWSPGGRTARRWLAGRGLDEDVLRANRVGSDPGPQRMERAEGLPRGGRAVVFPVLDADGRALYLQARYLRPRAHKYENPSSTLVGPSPRLAEVRTGTGAGAVAPGAVIVAEGIPDGLTAAQAGFRTVAVLGAGLPDERLAADLLRRHPGEALVIAFDPDHRGRAGAAALRDLVAKASPAARATVLDVPAAWGDLNGWLTCVRDDFVPELRSAVDRAMRTVGRAPAVRVPGMTRGAPQGPGSGAGGTPRGLAVDAEPEVSLDIDLGL